jgi:DNA repair exonuclease SbcCD nuclease subunit
MSKVIITGDLHIHAHRNDSRRIEDGLECLKWIYKTAEIAGISEVIIAGDFLHHRFSLNSYAYSKAVDAIVAARDNKVHTTFLLGNHDMYFEDNWETHSLKPLQGLATIIDTPQTIFFGTTPIDFLPYTPNPSKYLGSFNKDAKILISHLAVADAVLNAKFDIKSVEDDSKDKEVISVSAFNRWKKVWLGHYHYGQKVSKSVEYIGSPMQLSFGEAGQKKHIAIFSPETLETTYVENTISPQFHIVEDSDSVPANVTNSYIQMRSSAPLDGKFELRKHLSKLGAREIEFCPTNNTQSVNVKAAAALSNISQFFNDKDKLIAEYVNGVQPDGLDIELLKNIGAKLICSSEE